MKDDIDYWISSGTTATIYCHNGKCQHKGRLDLQALKRRLGGEHGMLIDEIKHVLKCSKCGGKQLGMIRHAPSANVNPYDQSKPAR